ncbi:hypothetical protein B0T26DRAFT_748730 [Lasiosphaeria miniovina]|uniref:Protein kinase domain-containing protein n=1 Tax=Lasiosphaeria miniovina TaxID=1954250 RepID=A0AA40B754_9PEZI|nr:uncharacterized protein B0T26DRAFT_748730 [Lasiosphaeria miniovina]KAK0728528.1 hypothetical protein B0T26DRAFT_748730 [Lasiosphaeria miniovina]
MDEETTRRLQKDLAEARAEIARQKKRADDEEAARLAEKKRADDEVAKNENTAYLRYLHNIQTHIPPILRVETNRQRAALGKAANANGKMLQILFGDAFHFPSFNDSKSVAKNLSPGKRRDEQYIRPSVRAYLETPSMLIVNTFLRLTDDPQYRGLEFQFGNNAYGTSARKKTSSVPDVDEPDVERRSRSQSLSRSRSHSHSHSHSLHSSPSPSKRKFDSATALVPDRWGLRLRRNESDDDDAEFSESILPGEYKAAHKIRGDHIRNILGNPDVPPAEALVGVCAERRRIAGNSGIGISSDTGDESDNSGSVDGKQKTAATADAALTAIWRQKDEMTIAEVICQTYHYMIVYGTKYGYVTSGEGTVFFMIVPKSPDALLYHFIDHAVFLQTEDDPLRVPAAQMATLILEALVTDLRDQGITTALFTDLPHRSADDADGAGGAGGNANRDSRSSRPVVLIEHARQEYCTQACLLGLRRGGPLDPACPNTSEHARAERQRTGADGRQQHHATNTAELCTILLKQLTGSLSAGIECLMKFGLFGAIGTLFNITLCGYGYTFVAKGVQDADELALKREAAFYASPVTQRVQGVLIPVYLGWRRIPEAIDDVESIVQDIEDSLYRHSIVHADIRLANLAWNKELKQVMALDFDRAFLMDGPCEVSPLPSKTVTQVVGKAVFLGKRIREDAALARLAVGQAHVHAALQQARDTFEGLDF